MSLSIAVVTSTQGRSTITKAIQSVKDQTRKATHYVFIHGAEYSDKTIPHLADDTVAVHLPRANGGGGYGMAPVFALAPFAISEDIICYLDDDNWYEPDHVEKLVKRIEEGNDWAYSLRKIYDKNGNYLCEDNCESLGKWPAYFNNEVFHIDTSSFAVRRDVAVRIGHAWYGQWGADRQFFGALKHHFPKFACTNAHTMCYRLDGNPNSVSKEFFDQGNEVQLKKYNNEFPWKKQL